jgi:hypothetical protein
MPSTLLVQILLESADLQRLYDLLPVEAETARAAERRIADCGAILDYLRRRFSELNRFYLEAEPNIGCEAFRSELARMSDCDLLRYGTVLKYICTAEANLADVPLDECFVKLYEAQREWHRRFGGSVLAGSV